MSSESGGIPENPPPQQMSQVETQDQVINEPEEIPQEELPTEGIGVTEERREVQQPKTGQDGGFTCPTCKQPVAFFITKSINSPYAKCPRCGSTFAKRIIPHGSAVISKKLDGLAGNISYEELIRMYNEGEIDDIIIPKSSKDKIPQKIVSNPNTMPQAMRGEQGTRQGSQTSGRQESLEENYDASSVFPTPKSPCDVLAEVFSEFSSLNPNFVRLMVNHCRRKEGQQGGIHPYELLYYLKKMKSGVKTEAEADFIVREYVEALNTEAEKARNTGFDYPMWLLNYNTPVNDKPMELPPAPVNPVSPIPVSPPPPNIRQYNLRYGGPFGNTPQPPQPPSQHEDNSTLIVKLLELQQKNNELILNSIKESMQASFQQMANNLGGAFSAIADALKSLQNNKPSLDEEKLKLILENKDKEFAVQMAKDQLERASKSFEDTLKQVGQRYEDLLRAQEQKIRELEERIKEQKLSAYNSDSAKLVHESIKEGLDTVKTISENLIKVVQERRPLEQIASNIVPKIQKIKTNEGLINQLEEEGLVDEGSNNE